MKTQALINPKMITWARETSGLTKRRLEKDFKDIGKWEAGEKYPTLRQAEKLAHKLKRPFSALYLNTTPAAEPLPQDYRHLPSGAAPELSPEGLFAIRKVRRVQQKYAEIAKLLEIDPAFKLPTFLASDKTDEMVAQIRKELGITVQKQFEIKNSYLALDRWKNAIESKGALVLEISMPLQDGRGMSFGNENPNIIILNKKDAINGRIFTLFHELAHLLLHFSGICYADETPRDSNDTEKYCNEFSGKFLVPKQDLINQIQDKGMHEDSAHLRSRLGEFANKFNVSREVILRRLKDIDLISLETYWKTYNEILEEHKRKLEIEEKKRKNLYLNRGMLSSRSAAQNLQVLYFLLTRVKK